MWHANGKVNDQTHLMLLHFRDIVLGAVIRFSQIVNNRKRFLDFFRMLHPLETQSKSSLQKGQRDNRDRKSFLLI